MKIASIAILILLATSGETQTVNFDSATQGSLPAGWTSAMTHTGGAPKWEVLADATTPSKPYVLAQTSNDRTSGRFPLAILNQANATNGEIRVKFKPISGQVDQAAGLMWRYRDRDNYYIVRANAREDNIVLYKVEGGTRTSLAPKGTSASTYGVKHEVPGQTWSTLAVSFQGNLFTVIFNGQKLYEVEDNTFSGAGKVGLWTKADSVTYFDDFEFVPK
jgi:hypothetical protein